MKKKVLLACALCVVLLASVLLVNTFRFTSRQVQVEAVQAVAVDQDGAAGRLADTIRFQTVSYQDPTKVNGDAFLALHRYLERTFPRIHAALTRETVGDYSLLYTWKGRDVRLKPVLLMAHQDVVPVDPETLAGWEQPPFEGRITDGFVWGRGSLDDKFSLLGLMEAVEMLLAAGFPAATDDLPRVRPRRRDRRPPGGREDCGTPEWEGGSARIRPRRGDGDRGRGHPRPPEARRADRNRGEGLRERGSPRRRRERSFQYAAPTDCDRHPERGHQQARSTSDAGARSKEYSARCSTTSGRKCPSAAG